MVSDSAKGYALTTLAVASLASHVVACFTGGHLILGIVGVLIFPIGIIHGLGAAMGIF